MTSDEARLAWDELVAIERNYPVLTGVRASSAVADGAAGKQEYPRAKRHSTSVIIADSIWGQIKLAPHEADILDSPLLQRLRNVAAVPMARMVYPGATHTRFEHTLGCTFLVSYFLESMFSADRERQNVERALDCSFDEIRSFARLAVLVKDVAYVPFTEMRSVTPHLRVNDESSSDIYGSLRCQILGSSSVGAGIQNAFLKINSSFSNRFLTSFFEGNEPRWNWLLELIDGPIGVNRIDAVARTCRLAALPASFDVARLPGILQVRNSDAPNAPLELSFRPNAEAALKQFLLADYIFHERVALNKTVRTLRLHWDSACSSLGLNLLDPDVVTNLTDSTLLENARAHSSAEMDVAALIYRRRAFPKFYLKTAFLRPDQLTHLVSEVLQAVSMEDTDCRVRYVPWTTSKWALLSRLLARYDDLKKYLVSSISVVSRKELSGEAVKLVEEKAS